MADSRYVDIDAWLGATHQVKVKGVTLDVAHEVPIPLSLRVAREAQDKGYYTAEIMQEYVDASTSPGTYQRLLDNGLGSQSQLALFVTLLGLHRGDVELGDPLNPDGTHGTQGDPDADPETAAHP